MVAASCQGCWDPHLEEAAAGCERLETTSSGGFGAAASTTSVAAAAAAAAAAEAEAEAEGSKQNC